MCWGTLRWKHQVLSKWGQGFLQASFPFTKKHIYNSWSMTQMLGNPGVNSTYQSLCFSSRLNDQVLYIFISWWLSFFFSKASVILNCNYHSNLYWQFLHWAPLAISLGAGELLEWQLSVEFQSSCQVLISFAIGTSWNHFQDLWMTYFMTPKC